MAVSCSIHVGLLVTTELALQEVRVQVASKDESLLTTLSTTDNRHTWTRCDYRTAVYRPVLCLSRCSAATQLALS